MSNLTISAIQARIIRLAHRPPFMVAKDLAEIYEINSEQIGQAVRRNPERFPEDFCFLLTPEEVGSLQNEGLPHLAGQTQTRAFTRLGANMLSAVLKSKVAAARSVQIMRAFSAMEERAAPPVAHPPLPETITLTKDAYLALQAERIELLKARIELLELKAQPRRRLFSEAEKAHILARAAQGAPARVIAGELDRPQDSIEGFLYQRKHRGGAQ